jgi:hypothetical protein
VFCHLAQVFDTGQIGSHFLIRPFLALCAALELRRPEKEGRHEPVRAVEPAMLKEEQIVKLLSAGVLAEDSLAQRFTKPFPA